MTMDCPNRQEILDAVNGAAAPAELRDHLASCASCRAVRDGLAAAVEILSSTPAPGPAGRCLSDSAIVAYARRIAPAERERSIEEHLASCEKCRGEAVDLAEALREEPAGDVPAGLERRIIALVPRTARQTSLHRLDLKPVPVLKWAVAAAAGIFVAILLVLSIPSGEPPGRVTRKAEPPKADRVAKEEPSKKEEPQAPVPPKEEKPKAIVRQPSDPLVIPPRRESTAEVPKPAPKEEPKPVVENVPKKEEPRPAAETKVEPKLARVLPVKILAVNGTVARRGGGAVAKNTELARADEILTDHRHLASLTLEGGIVVTQEKGTAFRVERVEEGETRLSLLSGTAYFKIDRRAQPFVVSTPAADAVVAGTAFQVEIEPARTVLHVVEGTIRFKNGKGEVLVQAGQRSTVRAAEKPTAPVKVADPGAVVAWARRPDLAGDPKSEPWMEHAAGANKKLAGLVVTGPYSDWETFAGVFAPAVAEALDAGLVLGHGHRDRAARIWMNIDRGTEEEVRADGSLAAAAPTERSKRITAEYLGHARAAAGGVPPNQPVPMIAVMRVHSEQQAGQPLEVCEVAWTGWKKQTIVELKALYEQLLEKHKPATRLEMRFQGVDDSYTTNGVKRKFKFTEGDAQGDGYMSPRHSQNAIAFFFPVSFSRRPLDANDPYAKILAEMVEWLYLHRR